MVKFGRQECAQITLRRRQLLQSKKTVTVDFLGTKFQTETLPKNAILVRGGALPRGFTKTRILKPAGSSAPSAAVPWQMNRIARIADRIHQAWRHRRGRETIDLLPQMLPQLEIRCKNRDSSPH
jgi:hypothetical protein